MTIFPIKALSDNYVWLLSKEDQVIIVDPSEASGVFTFLRNHPFPRKAILLTHNHEDHTGGVKEIVAEYPETIVYGPSETQAFNTVTVGEGEHFDIAGIEFKVFKTSGHTAEHISYLTEDALFCGDALFSAGSGRVFTGDYQAMYSAMQKFRKLSDATKVYAGHEYTVTNLRFAHATQPDNAEISNALKVAENLRAKGEPTLPSTIGKEKVINLFLQAQTLDEFVALRKTKDQF